MAAEGILRKISKILDAALPPGSRIADEGRSLAKETAMGRTAFMDAFGVASEEEYKRQCMKERRIMYHCHIGMSSWGETERGLKRLHAALASEGYLQDRAGICLDRRMALPADLRRKAPAETGPLLESPEDWTAVGKAAPIQPHMGDFMIGFPASAENTIYALGAGITTIGNLSQFFSHEAPGWRDTAYTTVETVRAISLMGGLRSMGTLVHSYLDDGMGALFTDCATIAGWAMLERYIVEELLGAKLAHCVGGLVSDPVKRSGWIFALQQIHEGECIGSMVYGDTISFTRDFAWNRAVVAETLLWDIMTQLECPTGHAVLSIPSTEAIRVPSLDEIIEAQIFGRRMESMARRAFPSFDFSAPRAFAQTVVENGRTVFQNALAGLGEAGVDLGDPVQLLYVLKRLGPASFEEAFGAGKRNPASLRGREAVVPNDVFEHSLRCVETAQGSYGQPESRAALEGRVLVVASTDVHEHALFVMERLLRHAGAMVCNEGPERNPDEIAMRVAQEGADAVLLSTHNGMALEYAHALREELEERNLRVPVFIGGVLNQKVEDKDLPVDVEETLRETGFHTCRNPGEFLAAASRVWR